MDTHSHILSWGYMAMWAFATLLGVVVAFFVFFMAMSLLGESYSRIPVFVAGLILACSFGLVIGIAQWSLLRRHGQQAAVWIGATILGFLVSSPVLLTLSGGFGPYITFQNSLGMAAVLGIVLGVVQWFVLRKQVDRAALWIGISLASWVVAGLSGMALSTLSYAFGPILYWLGFFFGGASLSAAGMVWLLKPRTH